MNFKALCWQVFDLLNQDFLPSVRRLSSHLQSFIISPTGCELDCPPKII